MIFICSSSSSTLFERRSASYRRYLCPAAVTRLPPQPHYTAANITTAAAIGGGCVGGSVDPLVGKPLTQRHLVVRSARTTSAAQLAQLQPFQQLKDPVNALHLNQPRCATNVGQKVQI